MADDAFTRGFSEIAETYIDLTPQARRLLSLAGVRADERVLDVGCGPGTLTTLTAESVGPSGHVIGIDLAEEMLVRGRAAVTAWPNADIVRMDAVELEFDDSTFDAVLANSVVQFSGPRSLVEWRRVTRSGGRVACSLPWGPGFWYELCRGYVEFTQEPYRSFATRQLAVAARRPDPEAARQRLGFAAVRTDVEDIVQTFATVDDAWSSMHTHGARLFLEALPADVRRELEGEFTDHFATAAAIELRSEFHYWCLEVP